MAGGGEKERFSLAPPPPPPPIVFSQFDVGSEFAWLVPVLISPQKAFFAGYNLEQSSVPVQAVSFAKRVLNQGFNPGRYGILKVK